MTQPIPTVIRRNIRKILLFNSSTSDEIKTKGDSSSSPKIYLFVIVIIYARRPPIRVKVNNTSGCSIKRIVACFVYHLIVVHI